MPTCRTLLLALALASIPAAARDEIIVAHAHDGRYVVSIVPGEGLVVSRGDEVVFRDPAGGLPRFDADGTLVFETAHDDGHALYGRRVWRWSPTTGRARRVDGDTVPPWSPAPLAADGGAVRLCLDPGHGGGDPGAVGNGLLEKDVVLDVALRLRDLLAADTADATGGGAWDVVLTRDGDVGVSLLQRVTIANTFGADSFVSIHANGFSNPAANGTETFSFAEGTVSATLRDRIHERMIAAWQLTDRGTKTAGFYVLVNTAMPASLSELAFITNPSDAVVLGDAAAREEAARAHLFALQEHHGFGVHDPGGATGTLKGILFDASLGSGAPIAGATVALADGTFTTTSPSGLFAFDLSPGTYDVVATAPGFDVGAASETVTVGDVWESFGLVPTVAPTLVVDVAASQLTLTTTGDAATPVLLAVALTPQLPLASLGGKGGLWVDASTAFLVPFGAVGTTVATLPAVTGAAGLAIHLQALATAAGTPRLTNGAAFAYP